MAKSVTAKIYDAKYTLEVECLVCGEGVELTQKETETLLLGYSIGVKVCDKCRRAVMRMSEQEKDNG